MGERRSYKEWSVEARGPTIKALLERAGLFYLDKKELQIMVVLAKPINIAFELSPSKAKKFFEEARKSSSQKAINRASLHIKRHEEYRK